jgi:hypothetical protein
VGSLEEDPRDPAVEGAAVVSAPEEEIGVTFGSSMEAKVAFVEDCASQREELEGGVKSGMEGFAGEEEGDDGGIIDFHLQGNDLGQIEGKSFARHLLVSCSRAERPKTELCVDDEEDGLEVGVSFA